MWERVERRGRPEGLSRLARVEVIGVIEGFGRRFEEKDRLGGLEGFGRALEEMWWWFE